MIVKNEEKNLKRCVDSVYEYVDQVIIVDTGSKDKTVEIAKQYTDDVYHFTWIDDFSAARNYSLEKVWCDWILVLDADECLSQKDIQYIKNNLVHEPYDAFELVKRSYCNTPNIGRFQANDKSYVEGNGWLGWQNEPNDILFRNHEKIYYEDKIHETVRKSLVKSYFRWHSTDIPVHHYGRHDMSKKQSLYIKLVKERYLVNPLDADNLYTLGAHLDWEGKLEEAYDIFLKCERLMKEVKVYFALGLLCMKLARYTEAKDHYLKMIKIDPYAYDAGYRDLMQLYFAERDYVSAFNIYKEGLKINPKNIILQFVLANLYYQLGYIYIAKGELIRINKEYPEYEEAKVFLGEIIQSF